MENRKASKNYVVYFIWRDDSKEGQQLECFLLSNCLLKAVVSPNVLSSLGFKQCKLEAVTREIRR